MEITVLTAIIGAIVGVAGTLAAIKKTSQEEGMKSAKAAAQLDYITKGVDDIRIEHRAQASTIASYNDRLIRNEEATKQAHRRIDNVEKIIKP